MSLYTNTQPYSNCRGEDGEPVVLKVGTTFKLVCYESYGVSLENIDDKGEKVVTSMNLDVFNAIFKEVDL